MYTTSQEFSHLRCCAWKFFWFAILFMTFGVQGELSATSSKHTGALLVVNNDDTQEVSVDDPETVDEVFFPTHEWQTVKPGQGIPRGLHVRINLQTGEKEAKLMTSEKIPQSELHETKTFSKQSVKELKEALRLLKDDSTDKKNVGTNKKFRSMEEIKEEFKNLNLKIITEEQIMEHLITRLDKEEILTNEQADIFLELEYYVHKYDNAIEFAKLGGIQKVILALNSSDEVLRSASAFLLGSAVQSNPQIKVLAVDNGAVQALVHHLAADASVSVQIKCLYALSCLIRQFPFAQKTFLELGGLSVVGGFFSNTESHMDKLQIKAIALLYDTMMEYNLAFSEASATGITNDEKRQQYAQVNIKEAVKQFELCQHVPKLLSASDHDTREKVFRLMLLMVDICWESFIRWTKQIEVLQKQYSHLAFKETLSNDDQENENYFSEISNLADDVLRDLGQHAQKHEL